MVASRADNGNVAGVVGFRCRLLRAECGDDGLAQGTCVGVSDLDDLCQVGGAAALRQQGMKDGSDGLEVPERRGLELGCEKMRGPRWSLWLPVEDHGSRSWPHGYVPGAFRWRAEDAVTELAAIVSGILN